jgi:hypothetical protein
MADIVVRIMGKDDLTPILNRIAKSSEATARAMQKMGTSATQGMNNVQNSAKKADQQLRTFERTSLAVGAATGALALGVIRVSAAYQQQERQLAAISRLYGDAGDEMIRYAETIQNTTKFSNDAARDSAVVLNTLVTNYGLANDQVEQLIMRSADLAQLHGRSLTEVTQMVSNALRGEGEYIEQIGVSMNQTFVAAEAAARGMGNFISGMTQAEQAAFRFQLLMEQTATAQGYAMETATGARGAIGLLINEFGDAGQSVGKFLGPVRDLAGEFQNYALWMPLIGSQIGRMTAIIVNSAKNGALAANSMKLLTMATSPLGLATIAVTGALAYMGLTFLEGKQQAAQYAESLAEAARAADTLNSQILSLYASGQTAAAKWVDGQNDAFQSVMDGWNDVAFKMAEEIGPGRGLFTDSRGNILGGTEADEAARNLYNRLRIRPEEETAIQASLGKVFDLSTNQFIDQDAFRAALPEMMNDIWSDLEAGTLRGDQISERIDAFYERWVKTASDAQQSMADLDWDFKMDDLLLDGASTEVIDQLTAIKDMFEDMTTAKKAMVESSTTAMNPFDGILPEAADLSLTQSQLERITASYERLQKLVQSGDLDGAESVEAIANLNNLFRTGQIDAETYTAAWGELAQAGGELGDGADEGADGVSNLNKALGETKSLARDSAMALKGLNEATNKEQIDALNEYREALAQAQEDFTTTYAEAFGMDDPLSKINLSSLRNEFTGLAGDITAAGNAMDTVFRVIVSNTNAIADSASGIYDWAAALIGAAGTVGEIDNLLATGAITLDQYTAAQTAYNQIAVANLSIQQSVLAVQTAQAPFIADFVSQQAELMRQLEGQSDVQQRITLGWMDSATATQAYTLMTQAAAVANGEMGAAGAEAFHAMIEGAIAVNPFLFDMLESIGLINGTPLDFEVNFDGISEGMSEIERLTLSIDALTTALGGVPPDVPIGIDVQGQEDLLNLKESLEGVGEHKEVNVKVGFDMGGDGGPLDGLIGDMLGGIPPVIAPVSIPVVPNWGGGVDSLFGSGEGGVPTTLDPISVEVIPEVDDTALEAAIPTGDVQGPTVVFDYDISLITGALMSYSGVQVAGPEIVFGADDTEPQMVLDQFGETSGEYLGPTFVFGADDSEPSSTLGEWVGYGDLEGPTVVFYSDVHFLDMSIGSYSGRTVAGPNIVFDSDDAAPSSDLGEWVGYGRVGGPTVVFSADSSAVDAAIGRYSGTSVIGTRYVDIVTRQFGAVGGGLKQHGGAIDGYAHGGQVIHMAENDRAETLHFDHGGQVRIDREGDYAVPHGAFVSPSNVDRSSGRNVYLSIVTGDWYGGSRPDLDEWAADSLIPDISDYFDREERATGRAAS